MNPVLEFLPTDVPHVNLRGYASDHFAMRTATLTAKSGVSRVRTALRTFVAAAEHARLGLDALPSNFVEVHILPAFADPVSKKMALVRPSGFVTVTIPEPLPSRFTPKAHAPVGCPPPMKQGMSPVAW